MANTTLFSSIKSRLLRTNATNEAGGRAYQFAPKHALAQMAATGCFNGTFYATAETQLDELRKLIDQVDDNVFLAKLAVYARERAFMKDMPAALLAVLSKRDSQLMHKVFDRVVDNGRVLRTLFQLIRSGQFGRTSLSSSLQRAFQRWLNEASVGTLLSASIGVRPSLRDVLRLAERTERHLGYPVCIDWAIAQSKLYLLRSEALPGPPKVPRTRAQKPALRERALWSHSEVGEAFPHPLAPLTWFRVGGRRDG